MCMKPVIYLLIKLIIGSPFEIIFLIPCHLFRKRFIDSTWEISRKIVFVSITIQLLPVNSINKAYETLKDQLRFHPEFVKNILRHIYNIA